jgi:hypothetical protein
MEIREKVPTNPDNRNVKLYPPKTGLHPRPGLGSGPARLSDASPLIIDDSFTLDDPGVIHEILGDLGLAVQEEETMGYAQLRPADGSIESEGSLGLGPAVHDEEAAAYISHFLRAGDAIDADKVAAGVGRPAHSRLTFDSLSPHNAYFVHHDEQAAPEALERLGPGLTDEVLSAYYACFIE